MKIKGHQARDAGCKAARVLFPSALRVVPKACCLIGMSTTNLRNRIAKRKLHEGLWGKFNSPPLALHNAEVDRASPFDNDYPMRINEMMNS